MPEDFINKTSRKQKFVTVGILLVILEIIFTYLAIVSYNNKNLDKYIFDSKEGMSFGAHLSIGTLTGPEENLQFNEDMSYFLKSYRGYLVSNGKITGTHTNSLTSSHLKSQGKKAVLAPNMDSMDIDFKELFVYKCLERL